MRSFHCKELEDGVEIHELNAGDVVELLLASYVSQVVVHGREGVWVTVSPRISDYLPVFPNEYKVHSPGVDTYAGDFQFSQQEREENVNIGISVCKGNTALLTAINNVLSKMTVEDFNELMEKAILIAPTGE